MRGQMRSHSELVEISGYASQSREFEELLRILDAETRLITPCDSEGAAAADDSLTLGTDREKCYQLTHDYLVPSLAQWLRSKQRETRRGRAELMLNERSALWSARPEIKQLPSTLEWLRILVFTKHRWWTPAQKRMLRTAVKVHLLGLVAALAVVAVTLSVWKAGVGYQREQVLLSQVEHARNAWRKGKESEAFDWLDKAVQHGYDHPAIGTLHLEMRTEGGATVDCGADESELEVSPDPTADRKLELDWDPAVISPGPRFRSGEHIRLAVGHYRVSVYRGSPRVADFPLLIDREDCDLVRKDGQWLRERRLGGPNPPESRDDSLRLELAEQVSLRLAIPDEIPDGFVYVNPGTMWRSQDPRQLGNEKVRSTSALGATVDSSIDVQTIDGTDKTLLVRAELADGFLIDKGETTVGDFRRWWGDDEKGLGSRYCAWRSQLESRVAEAVAETAEVPLEVHRDCWRAELGRKGTDVTNMSHEQILTEAFQEVGEFWSDTWQDYREAKTASIGNTPVSDDGLPVTASWKTAIAYARTHAPIDPMKFRQWVQNRIRQRGTLRYPAPDTAICHRARGI